MKLLQSTAFVLQSYPVQEADKICVFFTRDHGKLRGVAHGAKKLRSRFGASLEPLSEVVLAYHEKEGRELVTVRTCELVRSLFDVETVPEGEAIVHYFIELIDQFSPPHEPNEKVYRLISAVTTTLGSNDQDWTRLVLYFEVWLLKLSGYFPQLDHCVRCGRSIPPEAPLYLTSQGRPECSSCQSGSGGIILAPLLRREIGLLLTVSPAKWMERRSDLRALRPFTVFLRGLIRQVLETEVKAERFVKF